ncbi:site-specific DNA-methyltransferase [Paradevosia shaoguanensis]|uniref:site-specific DNA-methyltransferase (adenine-specific) n=1 Tax=Paradevosia shaoguanensis TaxID=1335043 RepID=A0AA41UAY1_9HYPH|nr:site-specific DNA-methyltransferase [Paradevosia shaoguanensis]MCF1742054.1 site-specific DNA-methyltransferase [Paradevosia shaoguanensis]MCI0126537.1 site-specific DNA-methyltransferase [Paradevosia shaoguanensis]
MARRPKSKDVDSLRHQDRRVNNPTAEMAPIFEQNEEIMGVKWKAMRLPRSFPLAEGETRPRDPDLDPQIVWNGIRITLTEEQRQQLHETGEVEIGDAQLVWRGKDTQDWSDLIVNAPPLYIQEKVHPKAIIDDLKRRSDAARAEEGGAPDLFADFNGLTDPEDRYEFYRHSMHWQNRFILGDSLQVMASLAQREGLKGKVQAIYFDPPYGIKFNSNWQVSTLSRDVKDGKAADITREPEQVKAFRDTWKDGIHSYLTYLRDRLTVARELLTESGSIFVQIGDDNVHRVRSLMDEVFGAENSCGLIQVQKTSGAGSPAIGTDVLASVMDYVVWFAKNKEVVKYRQIYKPKVLGEEGTTQYTNFRDRRQFLDSRLVAVGADAAVASDIFASDNLTSPTGAVTTTFTVETQGGRFQPKKGGWKTNRLGMNRLERAERLKPIGNTLMYRRYLSDFGVSPINNLWRDVLFTGFAETKTYVVQTAERVVQRCLLMATDPGDLVLDPTCGSGTTATVAEQWGRRWITIDTSRVALALARTRLMSARYPYYLLADSPEGRAKEGEVTGRIPSDAPTGGDIRQGFVYERAPHITLKSIANNAEIDIIWDKWQAVLEPLRERMNGLLFGGDEHSLGKGDASEHTAHNGPASAWQEWQIPRDLDTWLDRKEGKPFAGLVTEEVRDLHERWWEARIERQKEIDASIARAADVELLYDRPYEDRSKVRVAGPFTVESLSPHRVATSRDDSLGEAILASEGGMQPGPKNVPEADFAAMVLDNLRRAGVHQKDKADTIQFNSIEPWPGKWLGAEGRYTDGEGRERRAGILIGPEFGTLTHSQITAAAREASTARFDALIACAFNFDAISGELDRLGPLPILKARMNPDLHMADELKNTGKGNLFVVFGEPDIDIVTTEDGQLQVRVHGIDVFDPATGTIRSDGKEGIACWFIDTDYNEESFFVRHAYFLGANDPYKSLKTALRAEIDGDAWSTLYSDVSRPFNRPSTGRLAVKVINHFGDEVLKVFGV